MVEMTHINVLLYNIIFTTIEKLQKHNSEVSHYLFANQQVVVF